jgi:hypothetical protein
MQSYSAVATARACLQCGALNTTRFCGECGAPVAEQTESARQMLRESVAELVGVDAGVLRTIRDLVLRPVAVVRSYWAGNPAGYARPMKLFFVLAGVYLLLLSVAKPFEFDWEQLIQSQPAETSAVIHRFMAAQGVTPEVVNDRFHQWMNTIMPVISALLLAPLAWMLRRMNPSQPYANHLLFAASITNAMWIVCILMSPLMLLGAGPFAACAQIAGCALYGVGIFGLYPARTRTRTALRLGGFLLADIVLTMVVSLFVQIAVLVAAMTL